MTLASSLRSSWNGFLDTYEPLRPELYRYCRHLTRSPWVVDEQLVVGPWSMGDDFNLADCAAMPALHYANEVVPIGARWWNVATYLERLKARPSVARVLREAEPYFAMFPR